MCNLTPKNKQTTPVLDLDCEQRASPAQPKLVHFNAGVCCRLPHPSTRSPVPSQHVPIWCPWTSTVSAQSVRHLSAHSEGRPHPRRAPIAYFQHTPICQRFRLRCVEHLTHRDLPFHRPWRSVRFPLRTPPFPLGHCLVSRAGASSDSNDACFSTRVSACVCVSCAAPP